MSLREMVNKVAKETIPDWYVDELKRLVESMEDEGVQVFLEEVPDEVAPQPQAEVPLPQQAGE